MGTLLFRSTKRDKNLYRLNLEMDNFRVNISLKSMGHTSRYKKMWLRFGFKSSFINFIAENIIDKMFNILFSFDSLTSSFMRSHYESSLQDTLVKLHSQNIGSSVKLYQKRLTQN